ncbi:MAG: phosphomethylpyrimidine synthase ThiC [Candidatus Margulisbacteria bacterium]|nr:phosphomethylpyrimidine synthase ThiC [Candidatus Margulisiibacteriota bacterium]MBU1021459.1 phosphomethylpyrimidine synthase ThiC [Candidatus Margulisiibacteriota bacterium]MBU1728380.1 phosphomethylpyrimidine synthase ThiC [Candidatus Margulisiibacteriota bacterium]MBU1955877.1 phosphomethylpyrimidine synthase ThiC [Candidatus Margulisiibacteriota bacterium]
MTQLTEALKGIITKEMELVAKAEGRTPEEIRCGVAKGTIVIPANINHKNLIPRGIGTGLTTKVNANIGTSRESSNLELEFQKLEASIKYGADAVMDLSTGGDLSLIRKQLIAKSSLPFGTVPLYQAEAEGRFTEDGIFDVIEEHAESGVDFVTVHCGVNFESIDRLKKHPRVLDIVSRGGALTYQWILKNKKENPLYKYYDRLIEIALKYDVTLSLGDGMRPGCIADATDRAQIQELIILGQLAKRAKAAGVQVMIEGPGHVPLNEIEENIKLQKKICEGAPFYVLGPLPTDIAPGYDHITSAIGGALAGMYGADFLCYVTPSEHLGLPDLKDVEDGVVASKIAAHIADIAKGIPGAKERDLQMARARKALDWKKQFELAVNPERARCIRKTELKVEDACSMCGEFCSIRIMNDQSKST